MKILTHLLAAVLGGCGGILTMALAFAAGKSDEISEQIYQAEDRRHSGLLEEEE